MTARTSAYRTRRLPQGRYEHVGRRVILNDVLPDEMPFVNGLLKKKGLGQLVYYCYLKHGLKITVEMLDNIKDLGFSYATARVFPSASTTWSCRPRRRNSCATPRRPSLRCRASIRKAPSPQGERYNKIIEIWNKVTERVSQEMFKKMEHDDEAGLLNPIYTSWRLRRPRIETADPPALRHARPDGQTFRRDHRNAHHGNFREGLNVLQYFISTHGARKGLADTALKTADSGYLTRRLCDVAQDVIVTEPIAAPPTASSSSRSSNRAKPSSRCAIASSAASRSKIFTTTRATCWCRESGDHRRAGLGHSGRRHRPRQDPLRADLRVQAGVCQLCYGRNLATGRLVEQGRPSASSRAIHWRARHAAHHAHVPYRRRGHRGRRAEQAGRQVRRLRQVPGDPHRPQRQNEIIAMNRTGRIAVLDEKGRERERYSGGLWRQDPGRRGRASQGQSETGRVGSLHLLDILFPSPLLPLPPPFPPPPYS